MRYVHAFCGVAGSVAIVLTVVAVYVIRIGAMAEGHDLPLMLRFSTDLMLPAVAGLSVFLWRYNQPSR